MEAVSSLHGISETMDFFASWSGLHMNKQKTELFFAGLNHIESSTIAGFGFPIRYLGLIKN